jgi:sugar lactone lactonase YvrE
MVGAAVTAADGTLLVAGQEQLIVQHVDGTRELGARLVPENAGRRTNDGKVDPSGRFLIGTGTLPGDDPVPPGHERLLRVESDGSLTTIDDDLGLSNGLAWSADGRTLFSIDTDAAVVWRRDYEPSGVAIGKRELYLRVTDGHPDGMCLDSDGGLWIAIWGGSQVRRYAPDGAVTDVVTTTAPHTSSAAFVGPRLDRLLITSGRQHLDEAQLREFPDSGLLFLADVGRTGVPVAPWSGLGAVSGQPANRRSLPR